MKGESRVKDESMVSAEELKLSEEGSDPLTQTMKRKRGGLGGENNETVLSSEYEGTASIYWAY